MSRPKFHPPLKKRLVATVDGYQVYTVDAFAVRNASQADEEFDNVATKSEYEDIIPDGEIWTASRTWKTEGEFFLANVLAKLKARAAGKSADDAVDAGNRADQKLRQKTTGIKYRNGRPLRQVPTKIYRGPYSQLRDPISPVKVWLVDGLHVRCYYKTDYTEGGHSHVYPWVPQNEIWIEESIAPAERPYILAHEYIEMRLMREDGLEYDRAHEICSEMEFDLRKAKTRVRFPGLARTHFSKKELPRLTNPDFFEFVQSNYKSSLRRRVRALVSDVASRFISA